MGYIRGDGRSHYLVPADHDCRVIDAFVDKLAMKELGFERAEAAGTGRPGYDPRDMLKLYLYGYLNQIRSSRRLEQECLRNVELMWSLGRLYPDHKSIAEFRRMHREAITAAGARLVGFAKQCGLIRGEWIAIDGSKFRAVSSIDTVRERIQLQRYLDSMEQSEAEQQESIDSSAVETALQKLNQHPEPDAGFMLMRSSTAPAFNMQSAVDSKHAIIVAHEVVLDAADSRCLQPMAEATKAALGVETFGIIADAGYSNGEQAATCEAAGMLPHVCQRREQSTHGTVALYLRAENFGISPRATHTSALGPSRSDLKQSTTKTNIRSMKPTEAIGTPTLASWHRTICAAPAPSSAGRPAAIWNRFSSSLDMPPSRRLSDIWERSRLSRTQ